VKKIPNISTTKYLATSVTTDNSKVQICDPIIIIMFHNIVATHRKCLTAKYRL